MALPRGKQVAVFGVENVVAEFAVEELCDSLCGIARWTSDDWYCP